jgi:hypothetical protein
MARAIGQKNNILIAVAGSETDGTSGVRAAADATIREEIEKFSHVIFASSEAQREFWIGQRSATVDELRARYNGCKPCLHGSDAHDQVSTGRPAQDRFSWLKGGLTFDALRQACIDPAGRAFVGAEPPEHALPSQVISQVKITDASWAATPIRFSIGDGGILQISDCDSCLQVRSVLRTRASE